MQLVAIGLNHHTAPLTIRERLAFPAETLPAALGQLVESRAAREATIVSTCNRTELYCATQHPEEALRWLAAYHGLTLDEVRPYLYLLDAPEAFENARFA